MPTFGENLKRLRGARGWSQETLAGKLRQKRPGTVQSWEKSRRAPRLASVRRLADALECSVDDLLDGVQAVYATAPLTELEQQLLEAFRSLATNRNRRDVIAEVEAVLRGQDRKRLRESAAQTARSPHPAARKARGKRRADSESA